MQRLAWGTSSGRLQRSACVCMIRGASARIDVCELVDTTRERDRGTACFGSGGAAGAPRDPNERAGEGDLSVLLIL